MPYCEMIKMPDFILSFVTIRTACQSAERLSSAPDSAILKRVRLMNLNFSGKDFRKLLFILCLYLFYPLGMIAAGLWPQCVFSFFLYFSVKGILQHHARGTHMRWIYKKKFLFPLLFLVNPLLMHALGTPALWLFFPLLAGLSWAALYVQENGYRKFLRAALKTLVLCVYVACLAAACNARAYIPAALLIVGGLGIGLRAYHARGESFSFRGIGASINGCAKKIRQLIKPAYLLVSSTIFLLTACIGLFWIPDESASDYRHFLNWIVLLRSLSGILTHRGEHPAAGGASLMRRVYHIVFWPALMMLIFWYSPAMAVLIAAIPVILLITFFFFQLLGFTSHVTTTDLLLLYLILFCGGDGSD